MWEVVCCLCAKIRSKNVDKSCIASAVSAKDKPDKSSNENTVSAVEWPCPPVIAQSSAAACCQITAMSVTLSILQFTAL